MVHEDAEEFVREFFWTDLDDLNEVVALVEERDAVIKAQAIREMVGDEPLDNGWQDVWMRGFNAARGSALRHADLIDLRSEE